jgi:hypothetical protein
MGSVAVADLKSENNSGVSPPSESRIASRVSNR